MSDAVGVRIRVDGVDVRERKGLEMETGMAFYSISFDSRDPFGSLGQARLGVMVEPPRVMVPAGGLRIGTGVILMEQNWNCKMMVQKGAMELA